MKKIIIFLIFLIVILNNKKEVLSMTTLQSIKSWAYRLKRGERITFPLSGGKCEAYFPRQDVCKSYNFNGSTIVFYDENGEIFVVPSNLLELLEPILKTEAYTRLSSLHVPLSNGIDFPERKEDWEAIKKESKLLVS